MSVPFTYPPGADNWEAENDQQALADHPLLVGLRTGAWLDEQSFPPLAYAVPGIIPAGCTLLVGPPKAGKSWLALGVALAVASGGDALGAVQVGPARPVLLLALEDGDRRMQSRCRTLLGDKAIPEKLHYLTKVNEGRVVDTIDAWLRRHRDVHDPLVILDTLGKAMPASRGSETQYAHEYRVGAALKETVDAHPGAALVMLHHDRKAAADDFVDSVSGTHGLTGAADTVVVLARARHETEGLLKVTGRDVVENSYAVKIEDGAWSLHGDGLDAAAKAAERTRAAAGLGDRMTEIVDFVAENPDSVSTKVVVEKFGEDARRYLARLVENGRLVRPARGRYALGGVPTVPTSHPPDATGQRDTWDTAPPGVGAHAPPPD